MLNWRSARRTERADAGSVDVAARLHPYEALFNEAMAMAARFTDDEQRRGRRVRRPTPVAAAAPPARVFRRRAS